MVAAIILLIVSVAAALYQRSFLIDDIGFQKNAGYLLSFVSALGIPIAIAISAPYLGMMISMQQTAEHEWLREARVSFDRSKEKGSLSAI